MHLSSWTSKLQEQFAMNFQCRMIPGPLRDDSPASFCCLPPWRWGLWLSVSGEHLLPMLTRPHAPQPTDLCWSLIPQTLLLPPHFSLVLMLHL